MSFGIEFSLLTIFDEVLPVLSIIIYYYYYFQIKIENRINIIKM